MKVGICTWDDRLSPLFDVAKRLLVIDIEDGLEVNRQEETIEEMELAERTRRLVALEVNVLICGAISRPMEDMLVSARIKVIPQTCGPVEGVLRTFLRGQLNGQAFLMPGCCGRRRPRSWQVNGEDQEEEAGSSSG